jgi:hypothetical protein
MAVTTFNYYSSADSGSPGLINATTGSLLAVFEACLVTGYGAKPGAGWLKPGGNYIITAGAAALGHGAWQQPSGSKCTMFINDAAGHTVQGASEAYATGWEYFNSFSASYPGPGGVVLGMSASVGSGSGQFPLGSQNLTTGKVMIRKSAAITTIGRPWHMYADDRTLYFFIQDGNATVAGSYRALFFGDIFGLAGPTDTSKCIIHASTTDGTATGGSSVDLTDGFTGCLDLATVVNQMFISRGQGGGGASTACLKFANAGVSSTTAGTVSTLLALAGKLPCPNPADGAIYLSPIWAIEMPAGGINASFRGRMRGMWQVCHAVTNFTDGQIIQGSGDYAGKTFRITWRGTNNGFWAIEISNTVEAN